MTRTASPRDTIVARATPPGRGALAIVRVSGPSADDVFDRCFLDHDGAPPRTAPRPRRAMHGHWAMPAPPGSAPAAAPLAPATPRETIDEVVVLAYRAPASFTGEDALEVIGHGNDLLADRIVVACLAAGARLAQPGEFTRRAFENGRLDLVQARAVAELIEAETAEAQRQALRRLQGGLSDALHAIEHDLVDAAALLEAYIDFPDDDLGPRDRATIAAALARGRDALAILTASHRRGRLLQGGARVVIAGRPNAGKSSLFNALLGTRRAIVSPHPGTTRDTIEGRIDLDGLAVTLVDTAGLRHDPDHDVERLGIERTRAELAAAHAVVWLVEPDASWRDQLDVAAATMAEARASARHAPSRAASLVVWSKTDLHDAPPTQLDAGARALLAALTAHPTLALREDVPASVERASRVLRGLLLDDAPSSAGTPIAEVVCADAEQAAILAAALGALDRARAAFDAGLGGELVMVDLREALDSLATLTGTSAGDALIDRIFERFCLGK